MPENKTNAVYVDTGKRRETCYLGDGVFADHDDIQVWLYTSREGGLLHEVALDLHTYAALVDYVARIADRFPATQAP